MRVLLAVLAAAATLAVMVIAAPHVPGSPVACLAVPGSSCAGHLVWAGLLCVLAPLAVAVLVKDLPGRRRR